MVLKNHTVLFDIFTTKMESFHYTISFLKFTQSSQKHQICLNRLVLRIKISSFKTPPGPEIMRKLFSFLFDISTTKIQSSHHKISFL